MYSVSRANASRFWIATLITLLSLLLRVALGEWVHSSSNFLFFAPAVMVSAWYGGWGPGLLSTLLSTILVNYFIFEPVGTFTFDRPHIVRTIVFVIVGIQISWLSGRMRKAQITAEADAINARRSEKLYRTLASNFPNGFVCLFDQNLCWTLVAGSGLELIGLDPLKCNGMPIAETFPDDTQHDILSMCQSAIVGESTEKQFNYRGKTYYCHAIPIKSPDNQENIGMIIFVDVTERAKAQQALQWAHDNLETRIRERTAELQFQTSLLGSLSQASADGIVAVGNDGLVFFYNHRFIELWKINEQIDDISLEELKHRMLLHLGQHQRDPLSTDHNELSVDQPEGGEELILSDGRTVERYSSEIEGPQGINHGRVWFFRDITERKRLQREILEATEQERRRIGQELHDDLCQQLAGVACLGQSLYEKLSDHPSRTNSAKDAIEIVEGLKRINQHARELARGFIPANLRKHGLLPALMELCEMIKSRFNVEIHIGGNDTISILDENACIQLYRICQEAVSNAIRHGKAKKILVDLITVDNRLILTIEDNGIGITLPLSDRGLGLHTMNYRSRLIGASLNIERNQPNGTIVICTLPLQFVSRPETESAFGGAQNA